jgi:hypothetical protein
MAAVGPHADQVTATSATLLARTVTLAEARMDDTALIRFDEAVGEDDHVRHAGFDHKPATDRQILVAPAPRIGRESQLAIQFERRDAARSQSGRRLRSFSRWTAMAPMRLGSTTCFATALRARRRLQVQNRSSDRGEMTIERLADGL